MEENKDYRAYRYGDHLEPGAELKIEHSIFCEDVDISSLITMGAENLESMRQGSIDGEQKAYEIVVAAAKQWEQQAAATQMINRALSYLRTPEVEHTANEWRKTDNWRNDEEISNRVYRMTCGIWEDTKYDRETKQSVPVAWYVTWDVYVTGKSILKLLQDTCHKKGMTVIVITHNSALTPMADRIVRIRNGRVAEMIQNENPTPVEEIEW